MGAHPAISPPALCHIFIPPALQRRLYTFLMENAEELSGRLCDFFPLVDHVRGRTRRKEETMSDTGGDSFGSDSGGGFGGGDVNWGGGWGGDSTPAPDQGSYTPPSQPDIPQNTGGNDTLLFINHNNTYDDCRSAGRTGTGQYKAGPTRRRDSYRQAAAPQPAMAQPRPSVRSYKKLGIGTAALTVAGAGLVWFAGKYGLHDLAVAVTPKGNMHYLTAGVSETATAVGVSVRGYQALKSRLARPAIATETAPNVGVR